MSRPSRIAVVIVAAGRGLRLGGPTPKQYLPLGGEPMLTRTLRPFLEDPAIRDLRIVVGPDDATDLHRALAPLDPAAQARLSGIVIGGATRQDSVRAGLDSLADVAPDLVLVHDAARPFVTPALIARAIAAGESFGAAIPGVAVTDTIKEIGEEGIVGATIDRTRLRAVQTPQAFAFAPLLAAHRGAAAAGLTHFTDDAAVMEWTGHHVRIFDGDAANMKITTDRDLAEAERRIASPRQETRAGIGYDVHAFTQGDHVMLGGVRLEHDQGVLAHSDGDVVLHALTDALLGAIGDGDIGAHFPPSDPRWRGASSDRFLADAAARVRALGGRITHLDVTIVCESPRVSPARETMRARIAAIAGVAVNRVSVKATTSERLGFTGRGEGLAAQAIATVALPAGSDA